MIRVLALDIDGVLTDGRVTFDEDGRERKTLCYRDIDAVFNAHQKGLTVAILTGEDSPMVDVIARRLKISHVYRNAKDKRAAVVQLSKDLDLAVEEICYIGDSMRDVPALGLVGLGLTPADASEDAGAAAHRVLHHRGGGGAVWDAIELIFKMIGQSAVETK